MKLKYNQALVKTSQKVVIKYGIIAKAMSFVGHVGVAPTGEIQSVNQ